MEDWQFDQPRNCATLTVRQIVYGGRPILLVTHDENDHSWQFLTGKPVGMADAMVVGLEEVVRLDATLFQVADLPPGWQATRTSQNSPWVRFESERSDDVADQI